MSFLSGAFTSYSPSRSQIILGFNRQKLWASKLDPCSKEVSAFRPNLWGKSSWASSPIYGVRKFEFLGPTHEARNNGLESPFCVIMSFESNFFRNVRVVGQKPNPCRPFKKNHFRVLPLALNVR